MVFFYAITLYKSTITYLGWSCLCLLCMCGSVVVRVLDLRSKGRGFNSRPPQCRVATLGKWFTHISRASEVTTVWRYRNLINLILTLI